MRTLAVLLLVVAGFLIPAVPVDAAGPQDVIVIVRTPDDDLIATLEGEWSPTLRHLAGRFSPSRIAALKNDPRIADVVPDTMMAVNLPGGWASLLPGFGAQAAKSSVQTPSGIERVGLPRRNTGAGVGVAVLDTGVDLTHPDLVNAIAGQVSFVAGTANANDDAGHGTHVAGTIAANGTTKGVRGLAPGVRLYAVKVLDAQGRAKTSTVVAGLEWVKQNAGPLGIQVVNLSMGARGSDDGACGRKNNDVIHQAICDLTAQGVTVVVAAGNDGGDAARQIPAAYREVIAVSALNDTDGKPGGTSYPTLYGLDDTFARFSNYGSNVSIAAPGVGILSTSKKGGYAIQTGTSMAAPHVTAAAALYLATTPGATPAQVKAALIAAGEPNGRGHTDVNGKHPEPVLSASGL